MNIKIPFAVSALIVFCWYLTVFINTDLTSAQNIMKTELITVASLNQRPTGLVVSKQNRVFVSMPFSNYSDERHNVSVVEVTNGGKLTPYPNEAWNRKLPNNTLLPQDRFLNVQSIARDADDFLWVLDTGSPRRVGVVKGGAKLVKIDLKNNQVAKIFVFPETVVTKDSYLNDVRVDARRQFAYVTDSVRGGIIAVNLKNDASRMQLRNLPLANTEIRNPPVIEGVKIADKNGNADFLATDGIALDGKGQYLYFQYRPNSGSKTLYRIATKFLRDNLPASQLNSKVERVAATVVSDGIEIDARDYVHFTDIERNAISRFHLSGKIEIVVQDKRIKWADSIAFSKEGEMYFTVAQFHLLPTLNNGVDKSVLPFMVYKMRKAD